jgi:hypothetical protein
MNSRDKAKIEMEALERAESAGQTGRRQLWERQPGETAKAYSAFAKYRDLAEARTMAKVATMSQCSPQNVHRWARRWCWTQRCAEFDIVEEEKWRAQASRDRIAQRRRQVALGQALQGVAAYGLKEWQDRIAEKLPLRMRPDEIATLLKLGDDLERRGHGEEKDGGRFTRINVIFGSTTDQNVEESCRQIGGRRALPPGPMSLEELEAQQYQALTDEQKAAEATWRDPPSLR